LIEGLKLDVMKNDSKQERYDLAAAFRWAARLNMHEAVANHFSLAVSEDGSQFLLNPNGAHFSQICASDLLLVDSNDKSTMSRPNPPEPTAWAIHGAIHRNSPHARCILHTHSKYATILASLKDTTMYPIDQNTMRFFERVSVDTGYDGMGLGNEAERLSMELGNNPILLMGNHGVISAAPSVAQAFDSLYYFERSCETLVGAYQTGKTLNIVSDDVARKTANQWEKFDNSQVHFDALKSILDKEEPDYKN
jgi:ribulose-5-phosphate 4-epimerase/fuculose-1-phosphate aldolase